MLTIQTLLQNPVEALAVLILVPAIPLTVALLVALACARAPPRREFVSWADAESTAAQPVAFDASSSRFKSTM